MHDKQPYNRAGSALIIALMIIAIMSFIIAVTTFVINNSTRSSRNYAHAFRGAYALEAGEEYGLYIIYSSRAARTQGVEETVAAIDGLTDTFDNGASYTLSATVEQDNLHFDELAENEIIQFDMFGEDYSSGYRLTSMLETAPMHINISWDEDSTTCTPTTSKIELSFTRWSPLVWEDFLSVTDYQNKWTIQCITGSPADCQYTHQVDPGYLYRVRVEALDCDLEDVNISIQDSATAAQLYPLNYITVQGTGEYLSSEETGYVAAPWSAPILDYFDYVIFSEQDLIK